MQHIVQEIVDTLQNFIADEQLSLMLIEAKEEEAALILKTFAMVEEDEQSPDIFLTFADDFQDTRRYVELIIERQREQIELVNAELEKEGKPLIEPLPAELSERSKPSQERLIDLFLHTRKVVEPERQIIWNFYPVSNLEPEKEDFYLNLFDGIIRKTIAGEIEGTKIILRDTPNNAFRERFYDDSEENPKVFCYKPEVDFQTVLKKIEERAKNKELPPEERVQSVMLMAGVDVAEKRFDDALLKNQLVLKHYQKTKQKQNESVVQNNIGDIYYLQGDYVQAQANYEKAITIAVEEKSQPLVLYQSMNVGNSLFMQERYDEAFPYYESSEKLAEVNKVLIQQVQALERMGDTRRAQEKPDEAIEIYNKAADLCRENKYKYGLQGILQRLCEVYAEKRDQEKHDECKKELDETQEELKKIDPHFVNEK